MKAYSTLLFLITILWTSNVKAQQWPVFPVDSATGEVRYEGVVQVPGVSATDLYSRAKSYFLKSFKSANAVIQVDEPSKRIGGKGIVDLFTKKPEAIQLGLGLNYWVTYNIEMKEGRYRYELSQFTATTGKAGVIEIPLEKLLSMQTKKRERYIPDNSHIDQNIQYLILALQKQMTTPEKEF